MPANITFDATSQLCEMHISGVLGKSEFAACQRQVANYITAGHRPRVLVRLDGFAGWEKGADWSSLDFMFGHGENIAKIAIVGDERWEQEMKMFSGAGFRSTPVNFFGTGSAGEAESWVLA